MPDRPRAARVRIAATALVAAAVPVLWWILLDRDRVLESEDWQTIARLVLLSVLFWTPVSAWLVLRRPPCAFVLAAVLGLFSPLLCAGLAVVVGMALLPVDFVLGAPVTTVELSYYGVLAMIAKPHLFFPIGLGMGVVAFVIAAAAPGTRVRDAGPVAVG